MKEDLTVNEMLYISPDLCHIRLDTLLTKTYPDYSRTYFQYLIEKGLVLVNGQRLKKREKLTVGDEVEICFELKPEISLEKENIPLDILYEDDALIAINKPAGMVVHPAPGHPGKTFVNALLYHCHNLSHDGSLRPGIVHRLDKDTSGVLIAAKTAPMHAALVDLFASRQIKKNYVAICHGNPGEKTVEAAIKRHAVKRQQMCVDATGKAAISIFQPLKISSDLTWAFVTLVTGRTHQIRVHAQHIKAPILGDAIYGLSHINTKYEVARQMLHAYEVIFSHPETGKQLHIVAPIPLDMQRFGPPEEIKLI